MRKIFDITTRQKPWDASHVSPQLFVRGIRVRKCVELLATTINRFVKAFRKLIRGNDFESRPGGNEHFFTYSDGLTVALRWLSMEQIYKFIKINRAIKSHRVKYLAILGAHIFKRRYLCVRMDPVIGCNLKCRMCSFSNVENKIYKSSFNEKDFYRIAEVFFPQTLQLYIGCSAEPTLHKSFMSILRLANTYKVPHVGLVSNGQLLKEDHIKNFVDNKLDELTLSVHGVTKDTYEYFMQGASYEKLHEVLKLVHSLKTKNNSDFPKLRINYTVNKDNLAELNDFFDVFDEYGIDTLQIRPIMAGQGIYNEMLDEKDSSGYGNIINTLVHQGSSRKIKILSTNNDLQYKNDNYGSLILPAVLRKITPSQVWKEDFNWLEEDYYHYCRRISWEKHLISCIFRNPETIINDSEFLRKYAARYDVS